MRAFGRKSVLFATCGSAYAFGAMVSAWAQGIPQSGQTPTPPAIPEYAPKGLPLGAFRLFPTLELAFDVDDNVFRLNFGPKSDTFFEITPRLVLQSQWSRHYLALRGGATAYEYNRYSSETRVDWDVDTDGRIDIVQGTALFGGASYRHTYEPRSSPDQLSIALEPTPFNVTHGDVRVESKPNRFGITGGFNFDRYQYDPTKVMVLSTVVDLPNGDRDYDQYDFYARALYEFSPGYSVFGHFSYILREFDIHPDRNGVDRDSHGYRANAGVAMELTRLISGEFYVGYLEQSYKAPLGRDSGFNYGADITWLPTPLLTVRLSASHLINETVVSNVVSSITRVATDSNEQRFAFGIDYSFRRNIILHGDAAYFHDDFTSSGRKDDIGLVSFGATYLINSYMSANGRWTYQNRDSNVAGQDYEDNILRIGLGFQL